MSKEQAPMNRDEAKEQAIAKVLADIFPVHGGNVRSALSTIYDTAQPAQRERDAEIARDYAKSYPPIAYSCEQIAKQIQSAILKGEQYKKARR